MLRRRDTGKDLEERTAKLRAARDAKRAFDTAERAAVAAERQATAAERANTRATIALIIAIASAIIAMLSIAIQHFDTSGAKNARQEEAPATHPAKERPGSIEAVH